MTYTVSSGTLYSSILYHTSPLDPTGTSVPQTHSSVESRKSLNYTLQLPLTCFCLAESFIQRSLRVGSRPPHVVLAKKNVWGLPTGDCLQSDAQTVTQPTVSTCSDSACHYPQVWGSAVGIYRPSGTSRSLFSFCISTSYSSKRLHK